MKYRLPNVGALLQQLRREVTAAYAVTLTSDRYSRSG